MGAGPLHPPLLLPCHFTEDGALISQPRPPRGVALGPLSAQHPSLPPRPQHHTAPGRVWPTGSCVAEQTAEPIPAAPTGDHGHWGQSCGEGEGGPEPPRPGTGRCSPAAPQPATIRPAAANKAL